MEKKYILTQKDIVELVYTKFPNLRGSKISFTQLRPGEILVLEETDDSPSRSERFVTWDENIESGRHMPQDKIKLLMEIHNNIDSYKNKYKTLKKELSDIKIPSFINCLDDYDLFNKIMEKDELKDEISNIREKLFTEVHKYYDLIEQIKKEGLK